MLQSSFLKRDPNIHKRVIYAIYNCIIKLSNVEERRIVTPQYWSETKWESVPQSAIQRFLRGRGDTSSSRCIFRSLRWWRMAPGPPRLVFPRGGQLFKRGRERGREAEKSKGETGRNEKGRRKRGEAVGSGIGEVRGGRGQKAKRGVFWLAAKNRREHHQSTTGRSVLRVCERDRKEGGKEGGRKKRRRKKEKKKEKRKKMKKKRKKKKGAHTTTRWVWTRRMRAIPWRSISYPIPLLLDFLPIY